MKPEYKSTYYKVEVSEGGTETKVTVEIKPVELPPKEIATETIETETVKSEETVKSTEVETPKPKKKGGRKKQIVEK